MRPKIQCKICGDKHTNDAKHFPLALYERRGIFEGKDKNKKSLGIQPVLVGYACRKCADKHELGQFIKEHNIQAGPGQRLMDAVRNKISQLKMKPKYVKPEQKPKPGKWEKIKTWTKARFFKPRGRG